jgi:hypothetical protein
LHTGILAMPSAVFGSGVNSNKDLVYKRLSGWRDIVVQANCGGQCKIVTTRGAGKPATNIQDTSCEVSCKRKAERNQAFLAADLVLSERYAPVACLVIDASRDGFRLHAETPHRLPPHVTLIVSHPRRVYPCEVIWRDGDEVGLKIETPQPLSTQATA